MITSPLSGRSTSSGSVDKLSVGDTSSFAMLTRLEMHCTDIGPRSLTKTRPSMTTFAALDLAVSQKSVLAKVEIMASRHAIARRCT